MAKQLDDPDFGKLKWDDIWQGTVKDSPFGKRVPLVVEVFDDYEDPSPHQRKAYAEYRRVEAKVFPQVERLLFEYFEANKDALRAYKPAIRTRDKRLPDLHKPADVWRLAKVESILVPVQGKKDGAVVMVNFKTAWDGDHGTSAMIKGGKALRLMDPGEGF